MAAIKSFRFVSPIIWNHNYFKPGHVEGQDTRNSYDWVIRNGTHLYMDPRRGCQQEMAVAFCSNPKLTNRFAEAIYMAQDKIVPWETTLEANGFAEASDEQSASNNQKIFTSEREGLLYSIIMEQNFGEPTIKLVVFIEDENLNVASISWPYGFSSEKLWDRDKIENFTRSSMLIIIDAFKKEVTYYRARQKARLKREQKKLAA